MTTLLDHLRSQGLLEYGTVIDGAVIRRFIGLEELSYGTRQQFQEQSLREMAAVDAVREALLDEGKYLKGERGSYRILTPGENRAQARLYDQQAKRKASRGLKLLNNTPMAPNERPTGVAARLLLRSLGADRPRAT